jgi:hypothetical protein
MRFHVLGLPHTITTKEWLSCAYTQKVLKFCKMMHSRGHEIYHYGTEGSEVDCTEHITVISRELHDRVYDYDKEKEFFKFGHDEAYVSFRDNAIKEIGKRKQYGDFILPFWGVGVKEVCDPFEGECIVVEPGIGYVHSSCFAKYILNLLRS